MSHHKKPVRAEAPDDKIYLSYGDLDAKARSALEKNMYKQPFVSQASSEAMQSFLYPA
jgi:hypothetical protein